MEREYMEFDVVIVGAGPAGLSAACRLKQKAAEAGQEISVCVVEKGSEVGAHILSGAVFEPRALNELFPDWKELGAPLNTPVTGDDIYVLKSAESATKVPNFFVPKTMHNEGNYIISLGNLCRWLAQQAEGLGVEIYPLRRPGSADRRERRGPRHRHRRPRRRPRRQPERRLLHPGMELRAKYTLFAEGCRGHIGKQLIKKYNLDSEADAQHYGIGIKEIWDIDPSKHKPGLVVHTAGWPLNDENTGGSFLYHLENNQVFVGLIIDLSYSNPHLSPFDEFQRYKHHPVVKQYLEGGKRVAYGARAICKGGLNSLPKMVFPGGALIGCDLGTLNFAKIKGSHTAMKSGMLAADAIAEALAAGREGGDELSNYVDAFKASWLYDELFRSRNFGAAIHKFGAIGGGAFNFIDQNIFGGKIPVTLHDDKPDYACLKRPAKRRRSTTRSRTASSASTSCPRCSSPIPTTRKTSRSTSSWPTRAFRSRRTCRSTTSRPSATARQACTKWWPTTTAASASRSTRRTACTARPATSRTRRRTSPGWRRKVPAGRTTPTCKATKRLPREPFSCCACQSGCGPMGKNSPWLQTPSHSIPSIRRGTASSTSW